MSLLVNKRKRQSTIEFDSNLQETRKLSTLKEKESENYTETTDQKSNPTKQSSSKQGALVPKTSEPQNCESDLLKSTSTQNILLTNSNHRASRFKSFKRPSNLALNHLIVSDVTYQKNPDFFRAPSNSGTEPAMKYGTGKLPTKNLNVFLCNSSNTSNPETKNTGPKLVKKSTFTVEENQNANHLKRNSNFKMMSPGDLGVYPNTFFGKKSEFHHSFGKNTRSEKTFDAANKEEEEGLKNSSKESQKKYLSKCKSHQVMSIGKTFFPSKNQKSLRSISNNKCSLMNNIYREEKPKGYFELYQKKKKRSTEKKAKQNPQNVNKIPQKNPKSKKIISQDIFENSYMMDHLHQKAKSLQNPAADRWKDMPLVEDDLMKSDIQSDLDSEIPKINIINLSNEKSKRSTSPMSNFLSNDHTNSQLKSFLISKATSTEDNESAQKFTGEKKRKKKLKKLGFYRPKDYKIKAVVIPKGNRNVSHIAHIDITHKAHRRKNYYQKSKVFGGD